MTCVFPTSFSVNHTWRPSGVTAMSGQNGETWVTRPTIAWRRVSMTTVHGAPGARH